MYCRVRDTWGAAVFLAAGVRFAGALRVLAAGFFSASWAAGAAVVSAAAVAAAFLRNAMIHTFLSLDSRGRQIHWYSYIVPGISQRGSVKMTILVFPPEKTPANLYMFLEEPSTKRPDSGEKEGRRRISAGESRLEGE